MVANYIPSDINIMLQSENGFIGIGPSPEAGMEDKDIVNAGGIPVTIVPGGASFDSSMSFALIEGRPCGRHCPRRSGGRREG